MTPVDDAPVVENVSVTIVEDSSICFASSRRRQRGGRGRYDREHPIAVRAPQHGTAIVRANQTVFYQPAADFFGTDEFYVTITDKTDAALSTSAKVTVTVERDQRPAGDLRLQYYQTTFEDTAKDVSLTVSDVDNDLSGSENYTFHSSDESIVKEENITISQVSGDEMEIHIVPEANAYGTVTIEVTASDGELSAEGAFELKVIPVNDPPVAVNDTASVDEVVSTGKESTARVTQKTIDLLDNDSDVEDGKPKIVSITNVNNGTVVNLRNGSVLVSAEGDFSGDVTFTYTVMDSAGATASANVTLTVNPVNDPPRVKDDAVTIEEDAHPEINVLANDADPEGDALTIDSVSIPAHGTATASGTKVSYQPTADYYGTDSFTYTVSDGNGGTATATVRVTIRPVNDAPTISKHDSNSGDWTMEEDTPKAFHFVVADAESAVSNLTIRITSLDESLVKTTQIALTTNEAGYKTITVTPERDANGTVPGKFQVSDGLLTTTVTYDIEINSVNDAPVVTVPLQTVKEDTLLSAAASATDADGDEVTFSKKTDPAHGTVTVYEDGRFDYLPGADYNGEDSFIIAASDSKAEGTATVSITVTPDGDAHVARDDEITIDEDTPTVIPVLKNDSDEDIAFGDEISILSITTPGHGTAVVADGGIRYTPAADFNGSDTFRYVITDKDGKLAARRLTSPSTRSTTRQEMATTRRACSKTALS